MTPKPKKTAPKKTPKKRAPVKRRTTRTKTTAPSNMEALRRLLAGAGIHTFPLQMPDQGQGPMPGPSRPRAREDQVTLDEHEAALFPAYESFATKVIQDICESAINDLSMNRLMALRIAYLSAVSQLTGLMRAINIPVELIFDESNVHGPRLFDKLKATEPLATWITEFEKRLEARYTESMEAQKIANQARAQQGERPN